MAIDMVARGLRTRGPTQSQLDLSMKMSRSPEFVLAHRGATLRVRERQGARLGMRLRACAQSSVAPFPASLSSLAGKK